MQTQCTLKPPSFPASPGVATRLMTLVVLIAAYVGIGGWLYFKEERSRILQTAEIALWADARGTVNAITIWHAPLWRQGKDFAASDVVRLYFASQTSSAPEKNSEREQSRRQAMVVYLSRFAERIDAVRAALVTPSGAVLALGRGVQTGEPGKAAPLHDAALIAEDLGRGLPFMLPTRMGYGGPLLEMVFPVYSLIQDEDSPPLAGGLVLTFSLPAPLTAWTPTSQSGNVHTLLLETSPQGVRALSGKSLEEQTWRNGTVLPGKSHMPAAPPPGTTRGTPFVSTFWRLTEYTLPAEPGEEAQEVQAVAMRVPLTEHWYVVKEQPVAPTREALKNLRRDTFVGCFLAGLLLFVLLLGRWWWLDGRLHKNLFRQLDASRDETIVNRQIVDLIAETDSDGICVTDSRGIITYANPACIRHLGREEASLEGVSMYTLLGGGRAVIHEDLDAEVLRGGKARDSFETVANAAGNVERFTISKRPLKNSAGQVCGIVTLLRHIPQECAPSPA